MWWLLGYPYEEDIETEEETKRERHLLLQDIKKSANKTLEEKFNEMREPRNKTNKIKTDIKIANLTKRNEHLLKQNKKLIAENRKLKKK